MFGGFRKKTAANRRDDAGETAALRREVAMLKAALAHAPMAIAVYDENDVLQQHNVAYERIYAQIWPDLPQPVTYQALVRASLRHSGFKGDIEAEVVRRVAFQRQGDGRVEERQYADGAWRRVSKLATSDGLVLGYALDVSELRAREVQLEASKATLAEVAERTVPLAVSGFGRTAEDIISSTTGVKLLVSETIERAVSTSAAAEQLAVTIDAVATSTREAADGAAASMQDAGSMDGQMQRLAEALDQVNAFADMIRGIAAQTNLLALNATIEAARAGEAGRGFAVVAAEVKALSQQTGDATGQITTQVAAIEQLMGEARSITDRIGRSLESIATRTTDVASAVQQQRAAAQVVSSYMSEIVKRGGDTAAAAEQALSQGQAMASNAGALEQTVREALRRIA